MLALVCEACQVVGMVLAISNRLIDMKGNRKDSETVFWIRNSARISHEIG